MLQSLSDRINIKIMKKNFLLIAPILLLSGMSNICFSQDTLHRIIPPVYDPHYDKIVPDKVFEIGLPLLVLFLISNAVVNIFKVRAEARLKEKALDKQLSEQTLIALFSQDKSLVKYSYLKYFLILAALGLSFLAIQFLATTSVLRSGYLAVGIMALFMSSLFLSTTTL